jgi:hypothetical protein
VKIGDCLDFELNKYKYFNILERKKIMEEEKFELDIELPLFVELKEISNASDNFNDFGNH